MQLFLRRYSFTMDFRIILYLACVVAPCFSFTCPKDGAGPNCVAALYSNPVDCSTYYSCNQECVPYLQSCPPDLVFDPEEQACNYPIVVQCVPTTTPSGVTTPATTTQVPAFTTDYATQEPSVTTDYATQEPSVTTDYATQEPSVTTAQGVSSTSPSSVTTYVPPTGQITTDLPYTTTEPPPEDGEVVFCTAMTQSLVGYQQPVMFMETVVNAGLGYDKATDTLTAPQNGYYFFSLSTGASSGQRINFNVRGDGDHVDIWRYSNTHNGTDTTSRDIIMPLAAGQQVFIENEVQSTVMSNEGRQASFTGFNVKSYMRSDTAQAFSVANQDNVVVNGPALVPFTQVLLDTDMAFDTSSNSRIRINYNGTYFLSLSSGVTTSTGVRLQIQSTDRGRLQELWRESTTHNGPDVFSKALLVSLREGEYVGVAAFSGTLYSDAELQTSFSGFHYDPRSGQKAAWSVFRNTTITIGGSRLDPIPFSGSLLTSDNIFDFTDSNVHIAVSGYYYVHINMGAVAWKPVNVILVRGDRREEAAISRSSTSHNGMDTMGRGIMLEMYAGDTLHLAAGPNSAIFSDEDRQTSFSGFLIQAI